jgi:hypothetical protein
VRDSGTLIINRYLVQAANSLAIERGTGPRFVGDLQSNCSIEARQLRAHDIGFGARKRGQRLPLVRLVGIGVAAARWILEGTADGSLPFEVRGKIRQ